jgi:predicted Ser/Thr protein kinase
VQRAISADEDAIKRLCANYIENVRAYTQHEKVRNKYTGRDEEPDERLMRRSRRRSTSPTAARTTFRQEIMNYIGALALDGKKFEYHTNARLHKALELKLFEDQRDTIKLKNVVSGVVDDETQAEDRRGQAAAHQVLRLQRDQCHGCAELRGQHLRPRRQQAGGVIGQWIMRGQLG